MESAAVRIEAEPRPASESGLSLAFQPIADLNGGRAYAYEAVLRGRDGESASELFQAIDPEGRAAFDRRCSVGAVRWAAAAGLAQSGARLSIPVHAAAIATTPGEHVVPVLRAAREVGIVPERLIFSILDYRGLHAGRLAELTDTYRRLGCLIAYVGLGPDQSGLGICGRYLPDLVKLDPELVRGIATSWSRRIVLEEVTRRLRSLRLRPIATEVGDEAVVDRLGAFGINLAQGDSIAEARVGTLPQPVIPRRAA